MYPLQPIGVSVLPSVTTTYIYLYDNDEIGISNMNAVENLNNSETYFINVVGMAVPFHAQSFVTAIPST